MRREDDPHVDEVIEHVRLFLAQRYGYDIRRTGSPGQDERNSRACDAVLESGGLHFAVEHTSLDSFRDQREDDARFRAVLGELESELKGQLPDHFVQDVIAEDDSALQADHHVVETSGASRRGRRGMAGGGWHRLLNLATSLATLRTLAASGRAVSCGVSAAGASRPASFLLGAPSVFHLFHLLHNG